MTLSPPADVLPELPEPDAIGVWGYMEPTTYSAEAVRAYALSHAESLRAEVARLRAFANKVHEINENGLYREEIAFEGTGRYAVDIDAVDELGRLCDELKEQA